MTFGEYLKEKRIAKGINLRKMADLIGIAPAYLSDIEKGKRNSPSSEKMERIIEILELSQDEIAMLNDLAAVNRPNNVAPDISEYIMSNDSVRVALRKAREMSLGDKEWMRIIEDMEEKKNPKQ